MTTPDPVAISVAVGVASGIAGGVAGEVVKPMVQASGRWLKRRFAEHEPAVMQRAAENTMQFLCSLALRVERLEAGQGGGTESASARVQRALDDPDTAGTIQAAVFGAARTNSRERHEYLARAVAERLNADAGSARAVAASLAVEIMPRLSGEHLTVLGLLALIYAIRPPATEVPTRLSANDRNEINRLYPEAKAWYQDWLRGTLDQHTIPEAIWHDTYAHLAAAAAVIVERSVRRDLPTVLLPSQEVRSVIAGPFTVHHAIRDVLDDSTSGRRLHMLWLAGLQHLTLTPAGLLIGTCVHDARASEERAVNWEWGASGDAEDGVVKDDVWDGRRVNDEFVKALGEAVRSLKGRDIGPWSHLIR